MTHPPRKAGRPKAEPTAVIRLRVPVDAHAAILELGGDKWAKRTILEALPARQNQSQKHAQLVGFLRNMANKLDSQDWELAGDYSLSASSGDSIPEAQLGSESVTRYRFDFQVKRIKK